MKIAIACDHGALALKNNLRDYLTGKGYEVTDFGTHTLDSCDYPDYVKPAAEAVAGGQCDRGIVLCSTGIGVSIAANKVKGIRCALLSDLMSARLTREHNDTNMMAMGAFVVGEALAKEIVDIWLTTEFSQGERHARRIAKLEA
jgi:ribose 5-phosphate isomerase B